MKVKKNYWKPFFFLHNKLLFLFFLVQQLLVLAYTIFFLYIFHKNGYFHAIHRVGSVEHESRVNNEWEKKHIQWRSWWTNSSYLNLEIEVFHEFEKKIECLSIKFQWRQGCLMIFYFADAWIAVLIRLGELSCCVVELGDIISLGIIMIIFYSGLIKFFHWDFFKFKFSISIRSHHECELRFPPVRCKVSIWFFSIRDFRFFFHIFYSFILSRESQNEKVCWS